MLNLVRGKAARGYLPGLFSRGNLLPNCLQLPMENGKLLEYFILNTSSCYY